VRWRHPVRGLLRPADFLPVAEETGLIIPVGRWVTDEACRQLAAWQGGDRSDLWMSVNVSHRQFWQEGFVEDVAACLRSHRLDPSGLALEINEGVIVDDVERARGIVDDLHRLGCRLLIDDFGTGYSSLEVVFRLPIDGLKIDRAFVSRLGLDTRSRDLLRTIVAMAGDLQLIAEGVETDSERDLLIELGCAYGQGYLMSRPQPPHEPTGLLATPVA
jgi:EAL domain-containing protein (putative c-di-GMP-specific phosphodiesterase class I)